MGLLDNFSEETQKSLKRTFMECSIIFTMNKGEDMNTLRSEMFLQTVLALLVDANTQCTPRQLSELYKQKTGRLIDEVLFVKAFAKLQKQGFVTPRKGGYVVCGQLKEIIQKGVNEVETMYSKFVDDMVEQLDAKTPEKLNDEQRKQAEINIKDVVTLYAKLHGMDNLFGQDYAESDDDENEDIIKNAKKGLDDLTGNILVEVLADAISKPTSFQRKVINLLMQSFIGAQIMQFDPLLCQFDREKLKNKTFVFDTDFVLNSITKNHSQSNGYQRLIKTLRKLECEIVIPEEVLEEVVRHAQRAEKNYKWFSNAFESLDEDKVENEATNVFVKDYYMWKYRTKKTDTFKKFMRDNFLDVSSPNKFMRDVIKNELSCDALYELLEIPDTLDKYRNELTDKLIDEIKKSPKIKWRDDEEIQSLAKTDATLYLYTLSANDDARRDENNDILSASAYIITYTTKSIRCAKAMDIHQNIVTRPEILINILNRIGEFDDKGKMGPALLDNPFLTHIMRQNWQTVKKLSDFGVDLHGACITRLEYDLEEVLHNMMTDEAENEEITSCEVLQSGETKAISQFFMLYDIIRAKNYSVTPVLQQMVKQYKENEKKLNETFAEKEKIKGMLAKKVQGYEWYKENYMMGARKGKKKGGKKPRLRGKR